MQRRSTFSRIAATLFVAAIFCVRPAFAQSDIDVVLQRAGDELNQGPEAAKKTIDELEKLESKFTPPQRFRYQQIVIGYYAYRGMHREQTEISLHALDGTDDPDRRAFLLYYLIDGYANLGEYEKALTSMNDSISLLPKVSDLNAKMGVLQAAVSLLNSLHAYDDSAAFAKRLVELPSSDSLVPTCLGKGDLAEIAFLQHDGVQARKLLPEVLAACEKGGNQYIALSVKALDSTDSLSNGGDPRILNDSVKLLSSLVEVSGHSDYSISLADAIARRYVQLNQPTNAEPFAAKALQWANGGNAIQLQQMASETMALVLRAEGQGEQALVHLEQSNRLWSKLLEERSRKEMAYQRMKFRAQDQSIQLQLLERINKLLTSERELQDRNKHILELLVFVSAILLAFVTVSLMRMWRQKNDFKAFSQIDGLTRISNRSHFIACAHDAFKDARGTISVIVFDLDEFKLINDTYGHAAGDWVLKTISTSISACLRAQDMFGRLGGEEFAICLPRASEQEAMVLAERCRMAIEGIDSTPSGHKFPISASFGIAVRPPNGAAGFEEVLAGADKALYQAKHMGRNRIVPYGEVASHAPLVA